MNGAQALIRTLVDRGVDVCFTNPGTSEMHFVAALDAVPEMRGVLGLFEGVVTGAADGYARMADRPAATLLHLGPGLGNGLANLHNARKGQHADRQHRRRPRHLPQAVRRPARVRHRDRGPQRVGLDPLVRSARPTSAADAAEAVAAALGPPGAGRHADPARRRVAGSTAAEPAPPVAAPRPAPPVDRRRGRRRGQGAALGRAGRAARSAARRCASAGCVAASRVADATGAKLLCETFPARLERGAGLPAVERLGLPGRVRRHAARRACATWCWSTPRRPCRSSPTRARPATWCPTAARCTCSPAAADDAVGALEALADARRRPGRRRRRCQPAARPDLPTGALTAEAVAPGASARCCPRARSSSDEANTSGLFAPGATAGAPRHDWLTPHRRRHRPGHAASPPARRWPAPTARSISLEADGSAMYTIQSLWTQAREGLDVTTVIFNNRSYAILNMELNRVGRRAPGPEGQGHARPRRARPRLRRARRRAWACPPPGPPPPRSSPTSSPGPWPSPAPA